MADMYSVRTNGQVYYIYRNDGNISVGQFYNAAEAQSRAAIMNQQHNERFGKKKEESVAEPEPESVLSTPDLQPNAPKQTEEPPKAPAKAHKTKSEVPDPPPGQGTSY